MSWSVCPSTWQLEQEKVPVVEVRADSNKCHPCLSASGLGSSNAIVCTGVSDASSSMLSREIELSTAL